MARQKRATGTVDDSPQRHLPGLAAWSGIGPDSEDKQPVLKAVMVGSEPAKVRRNSSSFSSQPKIPDKEPLTFEQLETLACLLRMQEIWDQTHIRARQLQLPTPKRRLIDVADTLGVSATTVSDRIRVIEKKLGTYVVVHSDAAAPKVGRLRTKSLTPEETEEHMLGNPQAGKGTQVSPELTLDGRIWAVYAELLLDLHKLAMQATAMPTPAVAKGVSPSKKRIALPKGSKVPPPTAPQRSSEISRERFLHWLRHQRKQLSDAHSFLRENRYATPGNLDRLVPDYRPDPNEEPLYDYVDKFGEYPPGH